MLLPTIALDPRLLTQLEYVGLSSNVNEAMNSLAVIKSTISRIQSISLEVGQDGNAYLTLTTTDPRYVSMTWYGRELGWIAEERNPKDPTESPMEPVTINFLKVHLTAHFV